MRGPSTSFPRQTSRVRSALHFVLLGWLGVVPASCGSVSGGPQTSSSSHWLVCDNDSDCDNLPVAATCATSGETAGYCIDGDGEPVELAPALQIEFEGMSVDSSIFRFETGANIRNGELQTYTEEATNVFYEDGELVIVAREESGTYTSGSVEVREPVQFGRIEAEIRADVGSGANPSFWLLPAEALTSEYVCTIDDGCFSSEWPAWGSVVVLSGRADQNSVVAASYASEGAETLVEAESTAEVDVGSIDSRFHLYALEWGPDRIDWFVDGELVHSFDLTSGEIFHPEGENPFHQPFTIKLNLSVGGGLSDDPVPEDYPAEMRVRALRVFEYQ